MAGGLVAHPSLCYFLVSRPQTARSEQILILSFVEELRSGLPEMD